MKPEEIIQQIEKQLYSKEVSAELINFGVVETIGDEIVKASGLSNVGYYEEVEFDDGSLGFVLNIDEDYVSIVLLTDSGHITRGMKIKATGNILSVAVSDALVGRVVNAVGRPIDGKELKIEKPVRYPVEKIAPGIIERGSVDRPLKTGITSIDAMTPIGRGQRELIIGDRSTGKTAIAIDAIINQKKLDMGLKRVICIYCSIGQKQSNLAAITAKLKEEGAMDYTIIVAATASDPASMQYIAPLAACAIGEYFMDKGEDVLVVYDDLTKHAWAYRQISLLIKRPAGREAYPGDIFYLHSRLLERASRLSDKKGGGTLTALPIIETQGNDLSAYVPTNVISITDGQIYLEADLFNSGIRPAINVGLSVSRVGGAAQTKSMKQLAGPVRLELSQFRELQSFAQFGSDLDEDTLKRLERGKRITEILKQPQYAPYDEISEILSIFAVTNGLFDDIDAGKLKEVEKEMIAYVKKTAPEQVKKLLTGAKIDDALKSEIENTIKSFKKINNYGSKSTAA
ncbi:F0F1 ATP synthase subunit alpha [Endomicrobium proavitum]|uniref:ATP synthase subunit alpha n=1 Tax=Endomicrobium proavitum TaxID=1408281 RepID=A0A0G3WKG9_9BACT|nr:F0F1 ATP synthase subunit alpha [Endomicrobium proavitum]AKL97944.1 F1 sector of membrane-bound ATP synthase, alpha subunit [Endomicrobium proavitum]